MQQVKLFKTVEAEVTALERDVNKWIRDSGARVVNVTANIAPQSPSGAPAGDRGGFAPSDILMVILYEDGKL